MSEPKSLTFDGLRSAVAGRHVRSGLKWELHYG